MFLFGFEGFGLQTGEQYFTHFCDSLLRIALQARQVTTFNGFSGFGGFTFFGFSGGFGLHASAILRNAIDSSLMRVLVLPMHL
jgi:hypothetical protein